MNALQYRRDTLQPHAGVDRRLGQRMHDAGLVAVELHEAVVPYLDVAVDYSGYPDCRPDYIAAFETMANLATRAGVEGARLTIHAPLIDLSKADIIRKGVKLGVDYTLTVSCYRADADGYACGICDSCRLRAAGFTAAGDTDPTSYRT